MRRSVLTVVVFCLLLSLVTAGTAAAASSEQAIGAIIAVDAAAGTLVLQHTTQGPMSFVVDADTIITDPGGATLAFTDLAVGQRARVMYVESEGALLAKTIVINAAWPERIAFSGYVVALDATAPGFTLRNQCGELPFLANGATVYVGLAGYDELALDQYVAVQAVWQTEGWLAQRVVLIVAPRIVVEGTIAAIDPATPSLLLHTPAADLTVLVNDATLIRTVDQTLTFADLEVGDRVRVRMVWLPDGTWLATVINVLPLPPTIFEGRVTEKLADRFTVATVQPNATTTEPVTFLVNESTIYMQGGVPVTYDQVVVGAYVRVQAYLQPGGFWLAAKAIIVRPPRVEFKGVVVSKGATDFAIRNAEGEVAFLVDDATLFEQAGVPITFADVAIGDAVRVMAISVPTSTSEMVWLAKKVTILPPLPTEFVGVVTAIGASSFDLRSLGVTTTFLVDENTVITKYLETVELGALAVGDRVRVRALQQPDDSWLALRVRILPVQITVRGVVTAKLEAQFSVDASGVIYTVSVDETTVYLKDGVVEPTYADLAVGDTVIVTATLQADGSRLATRVRIIVPTAL